MDRACFPHEDHDTDIANLDLVRTPLTDGAIPMAKAHTIVRPAIMVLKSVSGIEDWSTLDDEPVRVAIALLIPEHEAGTAHIKLLSKTAEALMDAYFYASLKSAMSASAIVELLNGRLDA